MAKLPFRSREIRLPVMAAAALVALSARGLFFAPAADPAAVERQAVVQRVLDGDTVVLVTGERIRYIGIDTPELHHPKKPVEFYAREAKEFNRRMVEGKMVRLEFDVERHDKYGRLLAYVYLLDGTFVNAELIRQGYAQLLTFPPNVKYADLFRKLQTEAREASRGLWGRQ